MTISAPINFMTAVDGLLRNNRFEGSIYAELGGRIYYVSPPQNVTLPYLLWTDIPSELGKSMGNVLNYEIGLQFDLYGARSEGPFKLGRIHGVLFDALEGTTLSPLGFDRGVITCSGPPTTTTEEDAIRIMQEAVLRGADF